VGLDQVMAASRRPLGPLRILGRDITGVVSWNINDTCNYRCSYCTQRFLPVRTYRLEEIEAYLAAFAALPGDWEVKISGGEPFQQPGLVDIVTGLVERGHLVSVQTNFSASESKLRRFLDAARGALHVFAASLHLEYDTAESFLSKAKLVREHTPGASFCVTSVATPGRLEQLRDEVAPLFAAHGISFKVQPEKVHGVLRSYSDSERAILRELGGHNRTGLIEPNFRGRLCHAGSRYFIIKSSGEAYRCYPASRGSGPGARLGSFLEGIELADGPSLCPFNHCNCTVPIHRGMIQGVAASQGTQVDLTQ
jgi:organic radical activating enzyme